MVWRFGLGLDGFTRFGPTPKPGTGLWVQFTEGSGPDQSLEPNCGIPRATQPHSLLFSDICGTLYLAASGSGSKTPPQTDLMRMNGPP